MSKLVELATFNENPIYFVGINEYALRNVISNFLNLKGVKALFMKSLHFAAGLDQDIRNYELKARELLYLENYQEIFRIENGEIIKKINEIQSWRSEKLQKSEGILLFAKTPTIETLEDFKIVQDIEKFHY